MIARSRTRAFLLLASALGFLVSTANLAHAESLGSWTATSNYPSQLAGMGCALVSGYVYCVGGFDTNYNSYDDSYYAPVSGTGIGTWDPGPAYPTAVDSESCASANSTIYCVGGEEDDGQTVLDDVYYTQISASSVPGAWTTGATYPQPTAAPSCAISGDYVYCVGGFNANGDDVSNSYYAQLTSSGIGSWTSTTAYPKSLDSESCVASGGYLYCTAGEVQSGGNPNVPIDNVYYAQVNSSGIGKWIAGPNYPASLAAVSCAVYSGYDYCVGGFDSSGLSSSDAYYSAVSSSGMGSWTSTTPYPVAIDTSDCFVAASDLFCVGGVNGLSSGEATVNYSYFASLGASTSSTVPEFPAAAALPLTLAVVLGAAAVGLGRRSRL